MRRVITTFLRAVIVLIGIGVLIFLLVEPHFEGRNVNATFFEIYFNDPFLAYAYVSSIFFFVELYQAFRLLGYIGNNQLVSPQSVRALRIIYYCSIALVVLIVPAMVFLFIAVSGTDDIAGGVAMGLFAILVSVIIATAGSVCEKFVRGALHREFENELTA